MLEFVGDDCSDAGIPFIIIKYPVVAVLFKCAEPEQRSMWYLYNDRTLQFEPYPKDLALFLELEAAYVANSKQINTPCCFSPYLSALKQDNILVRYSKKEASDGVVMDQVALASNRAQSVVRQTPGTGKSESTIEHQEEEKHDGACTYVEDLNDQLLSQLK